MKNPLDYVRKWFFPPFKIVFSYVKKQFSIYPFEIAFGIFIAALFLFIFCGNEGTLSLFIASLGILFVALKYRLDQANYHRELFEKRYEVFNKINYVLFSCFHEVDQDLKIIDWKYISKELDSIYRRSYFLFGKETYEFIDQFRKAALNYKMIESGKKKDDATEFLNSLLDGQILSKKFPELKIDFY